MESTTFEQLRDCARREDAGATLVIARRWRHAAHWYAEGVKAAAQRRVLLHQQGAWGEDADGCDGEGVWRGGASAVFDMHATRGEISISVAAAEAERMARVLEGIAAVISGVQARMGELQAEWEHWSGDPRRAGDERWRPELTELARAYLRSLEDLYRGAVVPVDGAGGSHPLVFDRPR
jgi:hypothetical protein